MPKIIAVGEAEDVKKWEEDFAGHISLFKSQTIRSPIRYGTHEEGNEVAILFDVESVEAYLTGFESDETADAMKHDGIKKDTVKLFILDGELEF
ncbi:MAG: hypothetical protein AAGD22_10710 [Verrucomicrobiota bacterium]